MDPYDTAAVQRVWQRVRRSAAESPAGSDAAVLAELIQHELAARQGYERMLRHAGRHGPLLRQMAMQEREHARQLRGLFFLLFGARPRVEAPPVQGAMPFAQSLRMAHGEELESAARYRQAAERWPEHRDFFLDLSRQEQQHAANLRRIAAQIP